MSGSTASQPGGSRSSVGSVPGSAATPSAASSDLRKRFADAILEWLEEQGYNDEDADAILRAIFDKVNRDAE